MFPGRVFFFFSSKSVKQESAFKSALQKRCCSLMTVRVISTKKKTSIFIFFALVSACSALHKVTAFGFVGSIRFFPSAGARDGVIAVAKDWDQR